MCLASDKRREKQTSMDQVFLNVVSLTAISGRGKERAWRIAGTPSRLPVVAWRGSQSLSMLPLIFPSLSKEPPVCTALISRTPSSRMAVCGLNLSLFITTSNTQQIIRRHVDTISIFAVKEIPKYSNGSQPLELGILIPWFLGDLPLVNSS